MAINLSYVKFNLTVRKYHDENSDRNYHMRPDEKPKYKMYEKLSFKSLSAVEVMRKLIDYLGD